MPASDSENVNSGIVVVNLNRANAAQKQAYSVNRRVPLHWPSIAPVHPIQGPHSVSQTPLCSH